MLQSNKVNLIISIVAAIAIWVYVVVGINPSETRTIKDVPVTLKNVDTLQERGLTLIGDREYTVDVVIKGSRSDTSKIKVGDIEAVADVFGYPAGQNDVSVSVTLPEEVSKEDVNPSSIVIDIDKYVTRSKSIEIRYEGRFKEDTVPGFISMIPEEIEVSGAQSIVKTVSHIEAIMDSDDVKDRESSVAVRAVPVNSDGQPIKDIELSQNRIEITSTLCYIKTVPLEVPIEGEIDPAYEVSGRTIPKEVTIKGVKSRIDEIDKLTAAAINISGIKESAEIPVKITLPDEVQLEEPRSLSVVIELSGISVKSFVLEPSHIRFDNLEEGYGAAIENTSVTVTVYGRKSVIDDFSREDFECFVDMSGADYSRPVYETNIRYSIDKEVNEVVIKPATVEVVINKAG